MIYQFHSLLALTPTLCEVTLMPSTKVHCQFEPGQYVVLESPQGQRWTFTIAHAPKDTGALTFWIRRSQSNTLTSLTEQSTLKIAQVSGEGTLSRFLAQPTTMVVGGTGITHVMALLDGLHSAQRDLPSTHFLLAGFHLPSDLPHMLRALNGWPSQQLQLVYSGEESPSLLFEDQTQLINIHHGWVHDYAVTHLQAHTTKQIISTGPYPMSHALRTALSAEPQPIAAMPFICDMLPSA